MQADWVTWALQFLIVLSVSRVWVAVDKNTESLSHLREDIPKTYATKADVDRHNQADSDHHIGADLAMRGVVERVHAVDLRLVRVEGKQNGNGGGSHR